MFKDMYQPKIKTWKFVKDNFSNDKLILKLFKDNFNNNWTNESLICIFDESLLDFNNGWF